jgi:hypothetical protein
VSPHRHRLHAARFLRQLGRWRLLRSFPRAPGICGRACSGSWRVVGGNAGHLSPHAALCHWRWRHHPHSYHLVEPCTDKTY